MASDFFHTPFGRFVRTPLQILIVTGAFVVYAVRYLLAGVFLSLLFTLPLVILILLVRSL